MRTVHPLWSRAAVRLPFLLPVVVGLAACGDSGPTGTTQPDNVDGTWVATSQNLTVYVRITASTIDVLEGLDNACFSTLALSVVSRSGSTFTVREQGATGTFSVTLRLEGDRLRATGLQSGASLLMDATDQDLSGFQECSPEGTWLMSDGGFHEYVIITETTFTAVGGVDGSCFGTTPFNITSRDGNRFTITHHTEGWQLFLSIRNKAGTLVVTFEDGTEVSYQPTTDDPSTLDACGGGDDPAVVCADLPSIDVGQTVDGELAATDSTVDSRYYDLYGLTLAAQQQVDISLTSSAIDSYLYLWSSDGKFVAVNDDIGAGLDSGITITLDAGCYRIEATSYDANETGAYALSVN